MIVARFTSTNATSDFVGTSATSSVHEVATRELFAE